MKKLLSAATFAVIATVIGSATPAAAKCSSGFFANLGCELGVIDKRTANELDGLHKRMGNPLDRAANQVVGGAIDSFVPGAGRIVTGVLNNRPYLQQNNGGFNPHVPVRPTFNPLIRPFPPINPFPPIMRPNFPVPYPGPFVQPMPFPGFIR